MKFPVGIDNFKKVIESGYSFTDKSLLINRPSLPLQTSRTSQRNH